MSKITNGYNQPINFTYESLSTGRVTYTKGSGSQFPVNDIQAPIYVVSSLKTPDGVGGNEFRIFENNCEIILKLLVIHFSSKAKIDYFSPYITIALESKTICPSEYL